MKKINIKRLKNKFTMKPLFDDSDMYETKKIDDNISIEQLDKEIDKIVAKIK